MMDGGGSEQNGSLRVPRGGAYWNEPRNLRSANRNDDRPENRNDDIGFRCVRGPRRQHAASLVACRTCQGRLRPVIPCPPVLVDLVSKVRAGCIFAIRANALDSRRQS